MTTKTAYEKLTKNLDRIADNLHQIGEQNNLVDLSLLSAQLGAIKEDLARLLWVELPELNDGSKLEKLFNKSTGIVVTPPSKDFVLFAKNGIINYVEMPEHGTIELRVQHGQVVYENVSKGKQH